MQKMSECEAFQVTISCTFLLHNVPVEISVYNHIAVSLGNIWNLEWNFYQFKKYCDTFNI